MSGTVFEQTWLGTGDLEFLRGGGEMGALIRAHDWSLTPLGNPETWTSPLRTVVRLILNTGHPMCIFWGQNGIFLYNDAYSQSIGPERHPLSLGCPGKEVWLEIWNIIGPQIEQVMSGGGATWNENHLVPITRNGRREDVYWTYSYSPIDDDSAANHVGGVLVVCAETTAAVMAKQQLKLQMDRQLQQFRKAPGFITILSGPDHIFEFANDAYMQLLNERDLIGKSVLEAIPEVAAQGFIDLLDNVYTSGERYVAHQVPLSLQRSADEVEEVFVDFIYEPVRDKNSVVTGIFVEGHDVTTRKRAEDKQREADYRLALSEETLRLAIDAANIGTWDLDHTTDKLTWSDRTKAMFGMSPDMPCTMDDFYAGVHPDDLPAINEAFSSALDPSRRTIYDVEYRTVGKEDGLIRWVSAKGRGIFDEHGRCLRGVGTAIDITLQKNAQKALVASDARFRFFDDLSKAIQTEADPEAVMSASTKLLGEYLGVDICPYADVEEDGDTFHIRSNWTKPGIPSIVGTYSLDNFGQVAAEAQRSGIPLVIRNAIAELGEKKASTFTSIGVAATICLPLVKHGRLAAMMAVHSALPRDWTEYDISLVREVAERCWAHVERVGAQATLRESEQRFREQFDNANDFIFTTDLDMRITSCNPAAANALELSPANLVGRRILEFVPPETWEHNKAMLAAKLNGEGDATRYEIGVYGPGGDQRIWEINSRLIRDASGTPSGLHAIGRDVTEQERAAAALRQSEEQLRLILDSAPGAFYSVDVEGATTLVSWGFIELMGFKSYDDVLGVKLHDLIHYSYPDGTHYPVEECPIYQCASAGTAAHITNELFFRADGSSVSVEYWVSPIIRDGVSIGATCTIIDLTQRNVAEQALRESEERFRRIADSAPVPMWVTQLDRRRSFVNDAYLDFLGVPYDQAVDFDWRDIIHPDDNDRIIAESIAGEASLKPFALQGRYRRSDGRWRWLRSESQPRWGEDRVCIGFIGVAHDITEAKEAEAALRESEERFRAFAQAVPNHMWTASPDGLLDWFNDRVYEYSGAVESSLIGEGWAKMLHANDVSAAAASWARALATGEHYEIEFRLRRSDGQYRWHIGRAVPIFGDSQEIIRWIGTNTDIHDQKVAFDLLEQRVEERTAELVQAQEALRQSQKLEAMGQLTGGVAHDFNNLLMPILGGLDMLQRRGVGDDREQRMISGALQSAERAKLLVQRLLAFARRQPLKPHPVDISELISGMADLVSSTSGPNIKIAVSVKDDVPPALADPNQLEMAILNLSVNARDAMPDGGTLTLAATTETAEPGNSQQLAPGRYVRISVVDTGTGMDKATQTRAVEPFFSTKGIGKGTGLGLSMAHGLASQLGGALTISSRQGLGTKIDIWLPASDALAEAAQQPSSSTIENTKAGTVLLVDDEALVRMSTADMLTDLGYEVVEAASAQEALDLFGQDRQFDLLVTDHLMPGMSGIDLARIVREQQTDLPILIVSGYADADTIPHNLPRLNKPFRQADLAASVAEMMETAKVLL